MSKTERILDNLPRLYKPYPRPSALYTLANAIGLQLQEGENLLAQVMKAHWIDFADRDRDTIADLALLAALFDLHPFTDPSGAVIESVEDFRARIKRTIQTYLQGTTTVRGILRVTADTLGITIDEEHFLSPSETWIAPIGDATRLLFGVNGRTGTVRNARPAQIVGAPSLNNGVRLVAGAALGLKIGGKAHTVTLVEPGGDAQILRLGQIVAAINVVFDPPIASHDGSHLILTAPTGGASSVIEVVEVEGDAAEALFGIAPRLYLRTPARPAEVMGTVDLSGGVDLSRRRYLRLVVNDVIQAEVDLAGDDAGLTTLADIVNRINTQVGIDIASTDGHTLTLTTSNTGFGSLIEILPASANDAADLLLGPEAYGLYMGADAEPARFTSRKSLAQGVDLRGGNNRLRIKFGSATPVVVDCSGPEDETITPIQEIVNRINAAAAKTVATHDGQFITLTALNRLEILTANQDDGAAHILGLLPRHTTGENAHPARLEGLITLPPHTDLRWQNTISIGVDDAPAQPITFTGQIAPEDIVTAINNTLGAEIASLTDDQRLALTSPTGGADSRIELAHRADRVPLRFTTQAPLLDSGAAALLGFNEARAASQPATSAQAIGTPDLSQGVDLREQYYLLLGVDGAAPVEINCQGQRPRITSPQDIVTAINEAFDPAVASTDGQHLILTSAQTGPTSRIAVELSTATDAADMLLGVAATEVYGSPAHAVTFTGLVNLSTGIDVAEHYRLSIGLDGAAPVDIDLRTDREGTMDTGNEVILLVEQIVERINHALGQTAASSDGARIMLQSAAAGATSAIFFAAPVDQDATAMLLGISTPRRYTGTDDTPAELWGTVELTSQLDLSERRHLRIALDGGDPIDIDCAGFMPAQTEPDEIVQALKNALGDPAVRLDANRLVITSGEQGARASISVTPSTAADASALLLGDAAGLHTGKAGQPAVITGTVSLHDPVRLRADAGLKLAVDGATPDMVVLAGPVPEKTPLASVLDRLNAVFPSSEPFAALDDLGRLQLTAQKSVAVLPRNVLNLTEFPPVPGEPVAQAVVHGTRWTVANPGAAASPLTLHLTTQKGVVGPKLHNIAAGAWVRVPGVIGPGQTVVIMLDDADRPTAILNGDPVPVEVDPAPAALYLAAGSSDWQYHDCTGTHFDQSTFDDPEARFAGGQCRSVGVFDASHFITDPDAPEVAVFAPTEGSSDAGTQITMRWTIFAPGRFALELPYGLDAKFGARFDRERFIGAQQGDDIVIELEPVPGSLIDWINNMSSILEAEAVDRAPDGFLPQTAPTAKPVPLTGGDAQHPARLFVTEQGLVGYIELRARELGAWGNAIQVRLEAGSALGTYRITVSYSGRSVFENARALVHAQILQARAAGVKSTVSRRLRE